MYLHLVSAESISFRVVRIFVPDEVKYSINPFSLMCDHAIHIVSLSENRSTSTILWCLMKFKQRIEASPYQVVFRFVMEIGRRALVCMFCVMKNETGEEFPTDG